MLERMRRLIDMFVRNYLQNTKLNIGLRMLNYRLKTRLNLFCEIYSCRHNLYCSRNDKKERASGGGGGGRDGHE
jgi:hypothetical protein